MTDDRVCRWGILGAAGIARKNWQAIRHAPHCTLTAVASRDPERGRQFVRECQGHVPFPEPPRVCANYEELLAREDVDAVYLPLPTVPRKHWAIRAAEAGKHVLVEKPVGATADDVREILAACQRNRVQFMDGTMFMHSRRLEAMRRVLDDGQSIGHLRRITSAFTFGGSEPFFATNIRTASDLEPLGCLGDLGWYCIRLTLWAMNWALPTRVCGHMLAEHRRSDSPAPVPLDFSAELFFANGVSAAFHCSFIAEIQQWAVFSGEKGSLLVDDFVLPYFGSEVAFRVSKPVFRFEGCDFNMEDHTQRIAVHEYSNAAPGAQEANMFATFAQLVFSERPDPSWGDMALKTQQVLDACLASARRGGQIVALHEAS